MVALGAAPARQAGAELLIINREPTPLDGAATLAIHAQIGPLLQKALEKSAIGGRVRD